MKSSFIAKIAYYFLAEIMLFFGSRASFKKKWGAILIRQDCLSNKILLIPTSLL